MTRLALILAALLAACSPATTRRLCDSTDVVLDVARPETAQGELAVKIARFARAMFCPRNTPAGGKAQDVEIIEPGPAPPPGVLLVP